MTKETYHKPVEYGIGSFVESAVLVFDVFKAAKKVKEKSTTKMIASSVLRSFAKKF
jgi:hypothetical protein